MSDLLKPLVRAWSEKINLAMDHKKARFQDDADEAMKFFCGPYDFMYKEDHARKSSSFRYGPDDDFPDPSFQMTINKVAEMVQLFGPVLYHKNPHRQVNPRKMLIPPMEILGDPNNPMTQQLFIGISQQVQSTRAVDKVRASLMESYLNYTANELDLKTEMRLAIDEAIIKGASCLWSEIYQHKSGAKMVGSFWDTVDNLCIDPDMETLASANWIARRCVHPVWQVERDYGLKAGSLRRGNLESLNSQGATTGNSDAAYDRERGLTNDLLVYWKIYSKMGMGGRLAGMNDETAKALEGFGNNCYLVIADNIPYPLNLPPEAQETIPIEQVMSKVQWPISYWADDAWPVTMIAFHPIPRQVWPMSHLKPAMGEMKFLNWAYSFLASKVRTTCRDFIAILKSAGEDVKNTLLHGNDLELIEIEPTHKAINEVVQFLQHPGMNRDILTIIQAIEENFERRVGLTELMYGVSGRQLRSASEAELKGDQMRIRPDDMANRVEEVATVLARKEGLAASQHLQAADVAPILGQVSASLWQQHVTRPVQQAAQELEYRIEAGSARKPNKERDAANMGTAMQMIFQPLFAYAQGTGDFGPINGLLSDWAKSIDVDAEKYIMKPAPPPPPPPGMPGQPPAGPPEKNGQANGMPPSMARR